MRGSFLGVLVAVGLLVLGCSSSSGSGEAQGQMSVWLTATSTEGNVYRLRSASFRVSVVMGPEVQTVSSDDVTEPPPESIDLSVDPGSYTVELLGGWALYRVEPGDDVLVEAELASPATVFVDVVSGGTAPVVYTFQTNGEVVQTGPGDIGISIDVEETQCLGNPCDDGDDCTLDTCDPVTGACSNTPATNGTQCTVGMDPGSCQDGACLGLCEGVDCSSGNECIADGSCVPQTGSCSNSSNLARDTPCSNGVCDGEGACVECNSAAQCPGLELSNPCTTVACVSKSCQVANTAGPCEVIPGEAGTCENGECVFATECQQDINCDDANQCTENSCNLSTGRCESQPLAPDTVCTQDGGTVCDGVGACVECNSNDQCGDSTECTIESCGANNTCTYDPTGAEGDACDADGDAGFCQSGTCTSLLAPFDNDSIQNPAVDVLLRPTGDRELVYAD